MLSVKKRERRGILKEKMNFEVALKRLEEIAEKLEVGNVPLEESMTLFEEGMKLSKFCEKKLVDTEQKLEILNRMELPDDFLAETASEKPKKTKVVLKLEEDEETFLF